MPNVPVFVLSSRLWNANFIFEKKETTLGY